MNKPNMNLYVFLSGVLLGTALVILVTILKQVL